MKAKVTKGFPGVPDGEIRTRAIAAGEVITGDLARVAVDEGWADPTEGDEPEPYLLGGPRKGARRNKK
jgi:hypothetical protein